MKKILLEQLTANYDENYWFVSLKNAIEDLNEEEANWKGNEHSNSIKEIINHLVFWNKRYLKLYRGETLEKTPESNNETFDVKEVPWVEMVEQLDEVLHNWRMEIKNSSEEQLNREAKENSPWYSVLANIMIHNAYHAGQIIYIRKLKGNWDTKKGVH